MTTIQSQNSQQHSLMPPKPQRVSAMIPNSPSSINKYEQINHKRMIKSPDSRFNGVKEHFNNMTQGFAPHAHCNSNFSSENQDPNIGRNQHSFYGVKTIRQDKDLDQYLAKTYLKYGIISLTQAFKKLQNQLEENYYQQLANLKSNEKSQKYCSHFQTSEEKEKCLNSKTQNSQNHINDFLYELQSYFFPQVTGKKDYNIEASFSANKKDNSITTSGLITQRYFTSDQKLTQSINLNNEKLITPQKQEITIKETDSQLMSEDGQNQKRRCIFDSFLAQKQKMMRLQMGENSEKLSNCSNQLFKYSQLSSKRIYNNQSQSKHQIIDRSTVRPIPGLQFNKETKVWTQQKAQGIFDYERTSNLKQQKLQHKKKCRQNQNQKTMNGAQSQILQNFAKNDQSLKNIEISFKSIIRISLETNLILLKQIFTFDVKNKKSKIVSECFSSWIDWYSNLQISGKQSLKCLCKFVKAVQDKNYQLLNKIKQQILI